MAIIEDSESVIVSTSQILMYLADYQFGVLEIFDSRKIYRKIFKDYWNWREINRENLAQKIYYLKVKKLIKVYRQDKEKYLELTPKGLEKLKDIAIDDLEIKRPKIWDKKWRIVIFDIPNNKKLSRDVLRGKLRNLGFILLQESVFIHPFECKKEINFITNNYFIQPYVKYILADILDGDGDLINKFIDMDILKREMIK